MSLKSMTVVALCNFSCLVVFEVSVAYLQIYQEKIHDLLNFNNKVELHIREKPRSGMLIVFPMLHTLIGIARIVFPTPPDISI